MNLKRTFPCIARSLIFISVHFYFVAKSSSVSKVASPFLSFNDVKKRFLYFKGYVIMNIRIRIAEGIFICIICA